MTDDADLEALRAADPVDIETLPTPDTPAARALFERITMTDTDVRTTDAPPSATPTRPSRRIVAAVAAVAVLIAGTLGALALTNGSEDDGRVASTPTTGGADTPISPGGNASASCVEMYDLASLENREIAFDGTVRSVAGDEVTFTVNEAFSGVDAGEITLKGAEMLGGVTSAGAAMSLERGSRLLVAGDGGFAWSCGFTQPYDSAAAAEWRAAFAG